MDQPTHKEASRILDSASVVWNRLWLVLLCVLGVLAPIVYHNATAIPVYEARTSILFEEAAQPIRTPALPNVFARKSFIVNQVEIIKSRTLAEAVADALPFRERTLMLEQVEARGGGGIVNRIARAVPRPLASRIGIGTQTEGPAEGDAGRLLTGVVRSSIQAKPVRDSDIVEVTVSANTPRVATAVANTVTQVLKKRSLDAKREELRAVREFVGTQLGDFRFKLENAEQALKDFKSVNQVTSLQEEGRELLKRITEAEVFCNRIKSEREGVEQRLKHLDQKLSEGRRSIVPEITQSSSPYIAQLQSSLVKQEVEKTNLLVQDYPEDHPKVQRLDRQIAEIKEKLKAAATEIADGATLVDPVSQMGKWVEQAVSLRVQLAALKAQEATLERAVDNYEQGLQGLPEKELQLAQLMRARNVNEQIYLMLRQRHQEAQIAEAGELGNIRVVDPAEEPHSPVRPRKVLNLLLGLIAGLTLGIGAAFLLESLDTSLKTLEDVETRTGLSVLGVVPMRKKAGRRGNHTSPLAHDLIAHHSPRSPDAEAYRTLYTNVRFAEENGSMKTVLLTSSGPLEGKTDTAANLSIAMAESGKRTLLVDADLRRPNLHRLFGVRAEPGLADVLMGDKQLGEAVRTTGIERLYLLPRGAPANTPTALLRSPRMNQLLEVMKAEYDLVVVDSPPAIAVADPVVLSAAVDGVCLVAESGRAQAEVVLRVKGLLDRARARTLGVVLNKLDSRHAYGSYYYYRYYRQYGYAPEEDKASRSEHDDAASAHRRRPRRHRRTNQRT